MKKILSTLIVIASCFFINDVYAIASTDGIIGKDKIGDLLCSYRQDSSSGKHARASIYFDSNSGKWTVWIDNTLYEDWTKAKSSDKSGTFEHVFSNSGNNIYIDAASKEKLKNDHECPKFGGIRTKGANRPCFGNDGGIDIQCKMNDDNIYTYTKTYDYKKVLSGGEQEVIEDNIDRYASFDVFIGDGFCIDSGVRKALRIVGYILLICRYIVPIIVIALGSVDFAKAVMDGKEDTLVGQFKKFGLRLAIAFSVFFIPLIIHAVLRMTELLPLEYQYCETCLLEPDDC